MGCRQWLWITTGACSAFRVGRGRQIACQGGGAVAGRRRVFGVHWYRCTRDDRISRARGSRRTHATRLVVTGTAKYEFHVERSTSFKAVGRRETRCTCQRHWTTRQYLASTLAVFEA